MADREQFQAGGERKQRASFLIHWTQGHEDLPLRKNTLVRSPGAERLLNEDPSPAGLSDSHTDERGLYLTPLGAASPVLGPPA